MILCTCTSIEHQIHMNYDEQDNLLYVSIHLKKFPFWKRLKFSIKYLFGYTCKYGNFEEFIIDKNNKKNFQTELNKIYDNNPYTDSNFYY